MMAELVDAIGFLAILGLFLSVYFAVWPVFAASLVVVAFIWLAG